MKYAFYKIALPQPMTKAEVNRYLKEAGLLTFQQTLDLTIRHVYIGPYGPTCSVQNSTYANMHDTHISITLQDLPDTQYATNNRFRDF